MKARLYTFRSDKVFNASGPATPNSKESIELLNAFLKCSVLRMKSQLWYTKGKCNRNHAVVNLSGKGQVQLIWWQNMEFRPKI